MFKHFYIYCRYKFGLSKLCVAKSHAIYTCLSLATSAGKQCVWGSRLSCPISVRLYGMNPQQKSSQSHFNLCTIINLTASLYVPSRECNLLQQRAWSHLDVYLAQTFGNCRDVAAMDGFVYSSGQS